MKVLTNYFYKMDKKDDKPVDSAATKKDEKKEEKVEPTDKFYGK